MADERATLDQLLAAVEGRLSTIMGLFGLTPMGEKLHWEAKNAV